MNKTLPLIFFVLILGGLLWQKDAVLSLAGYGGPDQAAETDRHGAGIPVKVITQPVTVTSNDRVFEAVGTGRAQLSVGIYPSVSEEVMKVLFEAQQNVSEGDVLVQLDDRAEQLALKLAEVQLKDARGLLDRYEQAVKEGAVPESEVDAARADFDVAQVELDQAKLALEERQIKAPFDGVVGIPNVDAGDRVGPDTFITGLDARDILYVDFEVPEALAGILSNTKTQKQTITATTPAYLSLEFSGYISAQESRVDPVRRTLMARANIDNKADLLRPGMSFKTSWNIPGDDYATVPEIAVQWGREGSYVWLIRDGAAEKVPASVIARKSGRVLLDGEIKSGDAIVIEGLQRLRPGQKVEVVGSAGE